MRITFVLGSGFSLAGGDRVIAIYAERLQQRGHDVLIISRPPSKPNVRQQVCSLLKGQGWMGQPKRPASHFDKLNVPCVLLDSYRPVQDADVPDADVVIATWWETAKWVADLSPAKGAKAYFVQHHEVFDYLPQDQTRATYSMPLHKIAISKWLVDLMATEYGDCNVSYVPNSVDLKQFYAPPRAKQPVPTFGLVYNTVSWKGCDISLKAYSITAQKIPNLHLVAVGANAPQIELPLPDNTDFVLRPPQGQIKDIYAKCDAWLFGSRLEGYGLPILEAMACRTPVVGTPAGAAPELLADGAGILVKPENPESMAEAIESICTMSDAAWREMSDKAYTRAIEYTWDNATDLFEAALEKAISRYKRGELR
jgi:glycosyltransferase involved in cell wall biosynthesis